MALVVLGLVVGPLAAVAPPFVAMPKGERPKKTIHKKKRLRTTTTTNHQQEDNNVVLLLISYIYMCIYDIIIFRIIHI